MGHSTSFKDIELRQLRGFCLAATQGNFTTAARTLGLSVPAVWEQVRALERKLNATLLLRRGRTLELTAEGRLLLELIQPHVSGLDSVESLFQSQRAELPRQLSVAATQYLLANQLPGPIAEFTNRHPLVRVKLFADPRPQEASRLVESGAADVALITADWHEPRLADLVYEHLFDLQFMLLTARDHPLARKKRLGAADLVQYPVLTMPTGSPNRVVLERILRQHGLEDRLHVVTENASTDLIQKYVALGAGIALLHVAPQTSKAMPGLHARPFDAGMEGQPVALVVRKHAHLPQHVEEFCAIVRRHLAPA